MIKAITLTLIGVGILGTGSQTGLPQLSSPQSLHVTTGTIVLNFTKDGLHFSAAEKPDYAVTLRFSDEHSATLRL